MLAFVLHILKALLVQTSCRRQTGYNVEMQLLLIPLGPLKSWKARGCVSKLGAADLHVLQRTASDLTMIPAYQFCCCIQA